MQKTRLGISVGLMGSIIYFATLFGGYVAALLLLGYVLLVENNIWLKKTAVKAVVLAVAFSVLTYAVGFIPEIVSFVNSIVYIFNASFSTTVLDKIFNVLLSGLSIIKYVLFIVLGIKALTQGTITVPVVDGITNKHMDTNVNND